MICRRRLLNELLISAAILAGVMGCNRSHGTSNDPTPSTKTDDGGTPAGGNPGTPADITAGIQQKIAADTRIKTKQIQIGFENSTVKLTGTAATEDEVIFAGLDAMEVPGVKDVVNYLVYPQAPQFPGQALTQDFIDKTLDAVQKNIRSDPKVKGSIQMSFDRYNSAIRLTGKVATEDERIAVWNDAIKVTDLPFNVTLSCTCADQTTFNNASAPAWTGPVSTEPIVPLCPGLTVVTAIAQPSGDYESIKTIESVDSRQVGLKYSAEVMPPWWSNPHPQLQRIISHRTISLADLESAHRYNHIFDAGSKLAEGTGATAIGTSAEVLRELKTKGETEINLCSDTSQLVDPNGKVQPAIAGCSTYGSLTLKRVENEPVRLRVLMNGTPTDLPAVHARGQVGSERDEFFFLDDERNPLTLSFRLGIGEILALSPSTRKACATDGKLGRLTLVGEPPPSCDLPDGGDLDVLRAIKIETKCESPATRAGAGVGAGNAGAGAGVTALEKSLSESGTVDIYSIYFSFNSDEIRAESDPTLKEIAEVLGKHRDWKLRIAGHTDGTGNDQNNLDLSQRRASAVKDALLKRYKVEAVRLSTTGFGKSQPKDTNDTLEGRAHNRRVELMRIP